MRGKDPRQGASQSQPPRAAVGKTKKEGKEETLHEPRDASIGTQLLTKPGSLGQTGQNSTQRKVEVERSH